MGFRLDTIKICLGNSDGRTDQKARRKDDNTLGILKANLELKLMFIICSQYRAKEKGGETVGR